MHLITLNPGLINLFEIQLFAMYLNLKQKCSEFFHCCVLLCRKTAKPNDSSVFNYELIYTYRMLLIKMLHCIIFQCNPWNLVLLRPNKRFFRIISQRCMKNVMIIQFTLINVEKQVWIEMLPIKPSIGRPSRTKNCWISPQTYSIFIFLVKTYRLSVIHGESWM